MFVDSMNSNSMFVDSMMKILAAILMLLVSFAGFSCTPDQEAPFDEAAWMEEVEAWHTDRIESLQQDDSWLTLAGFFWLDEGRNIFGSGPGNDLRFDIEGAPERMGSFMVDGDEIRVEIEDGLDITVDGQPAREALIYSKEMDDTPVMEWESLNWYVIERSGGYAIRLRDREHPMLSQFSGIDRYPVSADWRVKADFIPFDTPKNLTVPNYIGEPTQEQILGALEFEINGETHRLYPIADRLDERFFVIFADETNRTETYSGGRFVYTDPPDENNIVYIDFNKSYNPPCVFSEFATCPLPPPENRLSLAIEAGELEFVK